MSENKNQILAILNEWFNQNRLAEVVDGCQKLLSVYPDCDTARLLLQKAQDKLTEQAGYLAPAERVERNSSPSIGDIANQYAQKEKKWYQKTSYIISGVITLFIFIITVGYFSISKTPPAPAPILQSPLKSSAPKERAQDLIKQRLKQLPEDKRKIMEANLQRNADLTDFKIALLMYYAKYKKYPDPKNVAVELLDKKILIRIPLDPKHNEENKNKEKFGYMYTLFKEGITPHFAVSALFEGITGIDIVSSVHDILLLPANLNVRDLQNLQNIVISEPTKHKRKAIGSGTTSMQ